MMKSPLTLLETESLEAFRRLHDYESGRIYRIGKLEVLGLLRDMIKKLENKQYGCPTGKHAAACTCKEPQS